ncbi:MAG TPA: hypothetical protein VGP05_03120 [Pseudonocardia sp.]|jgi:hypothetical protein|nr:hypothetical protein [Pseudonocardia sp.]
MAQGARRSQPDGPGFEADLSALDCPTAWEHQVEIPGPGGSGMVNVIALCCPNCDLRSVSSATDELSQVVAARRRTMAGLGGLPARTRADLAATGTLDRVYLGTVDEVLEAAERCRRRLGVDLPAGLGAEPAVPTDRGVGLERAVAVLEAATAWVNELDATAR